MGTQPRSGRLGACFLGETVFCARPGLRLWEVRLSGQIVGTHQLRPALNEAVPRRVVSACDQPDCLQDGGSGGGKTALGLMKLVPLSGGAVASFSGDAVFVIHVAARHVLLWTSLHGKVRDLAAIGDEMYVQCEGGAMRRLLMRHPSQIVSELRTSRGVAECARLLVSHAELTDLCRTTLPLQILTEAVHQFFDDAPMQVELARLAAVLRDRLNEDGVSIDVKGGLATPARQRSSATSAAESDREVRPTSALTDGFESDKPAQSETTGKSELNFLNASDDGDGKKTMTAEDKTVRMPTCHPPSTWQLGQPRVDADHGGLANIRSPPSPESSADNSVMCQSIRWGRRPWSRARSAELQRLESPSLDDPEPKSPHTPRQLPSTPLSPPPSSPHQHAWLPDSPLLLSTASEWYISPANTRQWRWSSATTLLGAYGFTPGLALHPEVLDDFSDLMEGSMGVMSCGTQRLMERLRRQGSLIGADGPHQCEQRRRSRHSAGAVCPDELTQSHLVLGLSELAAAAHAVRPTLPYVLHWLEAMATVHCYLQGAMTEALSVQVPYPALGWICAGPQRFVPSGFALGPATLLDWVSQAFGSALLVLVCDEQVCPELAQCVTAAVRTVVDYDERRSLLAEGSADAPTMATSKVNDTMRSSKEYEMANAIWSAMMRSASSEAGPGKDVSVVTDSGVSLSAPSEMFIPMPGDNKRETVHKTRLADYLASVVVEDETNANDVEQKCSSHQWEEDYVGAGVEGLKHVNSTGSLSLREIKLTELLGASISPAEGSPAWLAGMLTCRLFDLAPVSELRARLNALPAVPRARLWRLLVAGAETQLGPFIAGPGDVTLLVRHAAGAEHDWMGLIRQAVGLCRTDPAAAVTFCLQHGDRLSVLDALYMCRYALASAGVASAFTAYLRAAGPQAATALLSDVELAAAAEAALMTVWRLKAVQLRCPCGWPLPGAHRAPRPAARLVRTLLSSRLAGERLSEELWSLADWIGWLEIATSASAAQQRRLASVVCQLNDWALLPAASRLLTSWWPLVMALADGRPDQCRGCAGPLRPLTTETSCQRPLTVYSLMTLVISQDGPSIASQLLQATSDLAPCLQVTTR